MGGALGRCTACVNNSSRFKRKYTGTYKLTQHKVPEGHCWLAGDNIPDSRDSRDYGPVPLALIKGKVLGVILPIRERRWIENSLHRVEGAENG